MRNTPTLVAIAILFLIFSGKSFAANPDFSGSWMLDTAKSEGLPPGMKQEMTIKQEGDKLTVETKLTTDKGEQIIPDSYLLDGKETDFTPKLPDGTSGKGKRTAKWITNGIEVKDVAVYDTPDGDVTVKMTRKWTLSADGKTLQIEIDADGPQGTQIVKRIFIKK